MMIITWYTRLSATEPVKPVVTCLWVLQTGQVYLELHTAITVKDYLLSVTGCLQKFTQSSKYYLLTFKLKKHCLNLFVPDLFVLFHVSGSMNHVI